MAVLQHNNIRTKVLSLLLVLIAWSTVFNSTVSKNPFDAPDSTEHSPSSSNLQIRSTGVALGERERVATTPQQIATQSNKSDDGCAIFGAPLQSQSQYEQSTKLPKWMKGTCVDFGFSSGDEEQFQAESNRAIIVC